MAYADLPRGYIRDEQLAQRHCPITLLPLLGLADAAFWQRHQQVVGAKFDALMTWWRQAGTDPETRRALKMTDLFVSGGDDPGPAAGPLGQLRDDSMLPRATL